MGYSDTISELRESLNGYSAEEEKIAELYAKALEDEKVEFRNSENLLHYTYGMERHAAYSDNARNDRSYNQFLAARGLGFSGEAAQAKLNSNILLTNRLRQIGLENAKTTQELKENYNNNVTKLKAEQAEKMKEIFDNKNQLTADIAALELENETSQAKLKADQAMHDAELQAKKDMFYAELAAKYNNVTSGKGTGSGADYGTGTGSGTGEGGEDGAVSHSYIPNISTESLAKYIVNTATSGDTDIRSDAAAYSINKYLVNLYENYNVDYDYFNELVFMLGMHGFNAGSYPEMRIQMITYETDMKYDKTYDDSYEKFLVGGMSEAGARAAAKKDAVYQSMMYIYKKANNISEFEKCCSVMGFSANDIADFLERNHSDTPIISGGGSGGGYTTRDT